MSKDEIISGQIEFCEKDEEILTLNIKAAIYARVSTADKGQDPEMQLRDLRSHAEDRGWTIAGEYVDTMTSSKDTRPAFKELMRASKERKHDIVLVWKLNSFSRSLIHLVTAANELHAVGAQFVSLKDSIDFTTPAGRLQFHVMAALAEFERENIRENVRAGLANARAKGTRLGRRPAAPIERKRIIEAYLAAPDLSVRKLADKVKANYGTVNKTLSLFRSGKCDKDGFLYENPLC